MTGHISVPLDEAQKAQLEAIAEASQESVGDLAARAVAEFLEEDAAFRAAGEVDDFDTYRQNLERRMATRFAASRLDAPHHPAGAGRHRQCVRLSIRGEPKGRSARHRSRHPGHRQAGPCALHGPTGSRIRRPGVGDPRTSYIAIYDVTEIGVTEIGVTVLRVMHGRQEWPPVRDGQQKSPPG
jgi:hypothetical protein